MACKPDSEGACLRPLEGLLLHHLKLAVWLEGGNDVRQWRWGRMHHFSIPKWAQCHRNSAALLRGHHRPGGKMMDELPSSLSCLTTVYTHTHTHTLAQTRVCLQRAMFSLAAVLCSDTDVSLQLFASVCESIWQASNALKIRTLILFTPIMTLILK